MRGKKAMYCETDAQVSQNFTLQNDGTQGCYCHRHLKTVSSQQNWFLPPVHKSHSPTKFKQSPGQQKWWLLYPTFLQSSFSRSKNNPANTIITIESFYFSVPYNTRNCTIFWKLTELIGTPHFIKTGSGNLCVPRKRSRKSQLLVTLVQDTFQMMEYHLYLYSYV